MAKSKITIFLGCTNIASSTTFCEVKLQGKDGRWKLINGSETVCKKADLQFTTPFHVEYEGNQELEISLMEQKSAGRKIVGRCQFDVTLLDESSFKQRKLLDENLKHLAEGKNSGAPVNVNIYKFDFVENIGLAASLQIQAYALAVKDFFGSSSDPFFEVCRLHTSGHDTESGGGTWVPVYRSNVIRRDLNPRWGKFTIPLSNLNGFKDQIKLFFYDYDNDGGHDLIGHVTTTLTSLEAKVSTTAYSDKDFESMKEKCPSDCLPIVHPHTKEKYDPAKGYTHSGCLQVVRCEIPKFKKAESTELSATPGTKSDTSNKPNDDLAQQTENHRRHYLDEVHRADTEFSKSGALLDTFQLLQNAIKTRPILWSEFVNDFVFERPQELKKKLSNWRCKHIILSKGKAVEICSALLACGLQDQFHCVLSTTAKLFRPRKGYTRPPGVVNACGITEAFLEAWVQDDRVQKEYPSGFPKDEFIADEMQTHWNLLLPGLETKGQTPTRVVYIDDDPDRDYLPDTVTVVQLPREGAGIMSTHGQAALQAARVDLDSLRCTDVVVWDFDCTLTKTHLYKTLERRASGDKWGSAFAAWWSAQRREADVARNDVRGDLQRKMAELQRIKLLQAEAEAAQKREADAEGKKADKRKDGAGLSRNDNNNVATARVPFHNADVNTSTDADTDTNTDTDTDTDTDESRSSIDEKKATAVPRHEIGDSVNTDTQLRQNQHVPEAVRKESEGKVEDENSKLNAEAEKWKTEAEKWKTKAEASEVKAKAAQAEAESARRWKAVAESVGKKFAEADAEKRKAVSEAEQYKALIGAEKRKADERRVEAEAMTARQRRAEREAAKKHKAAIERLKDEAEKFKADVETWKVEAETRRAASESWRAEAAIRKAEVEELAQKQKAEVAQTRAAETVARKCQAEVNKWKGKAEKSQAEVNKWKGKAEKNQAEVNKWKGKAEKSQTEVNKWKGKAEKCQAEIEQLKGKAKKWKVEVEKLKGQAEKFKAEVKSEKRKAEIAAETARKKHTNAEKWKKQLVATRKQKSVMSISLLHGVCFLGHTLAFFGYSFFSCKLPFLDLYNPIVKYSFYSCSLLLPIASLGLLWRTLQNVESEANKWKNEAEKWKEEAEKLRDEAQCIV